MSGMRTGLFLLALCSFLIAEEADLKKTIDSFCEPLVASGRVVGMSIAVRSGGKVYFRGYGRFTKDSKRVPDQDSIYEIGSISKVFTGVLLASLVHEGKLKVDDPITAHLPGPAPKRITLRHLSTHRSGLPRLPSNIKPDNPNQPYSGYDAEPLYAFLKGVKVASSPAPYAYSNLGAGLLGHIVARKAGMSYEDLMIARIAKPLKMTSTALTLTDEQKKRLVPGHLAGGVKVPSWPWKDSALAGAGAIRSTTRDMMKFAEAQFGNDPVQALARKVHTTNPPKMGLGWHYGQFDAIWHNGQTGGYKSYLAIDLKDKMVVVVLANTTAAEVDQLANMLFLRLKGQPIKPLELKPERKVAAAILKRYVGTYAIVPQFKATVRVENGGLVVQWTNQPSLPVFSDSDTEFRYRAVKARIEFHVGADGKTTGLTLHQNGRAMKAPKEAAPSD